MSEDSLTSTENINIKYLEEGVVVDGERFDSLQDYFRFREEQYKNRSAGTTDSEAGN